MTTNDNQSSFQVRDGDRDLRFEGELLGHSSSWRVGKTRWAEISIYRTCEGSYVVSGVGRTLVPGEVDRPWAQTFTDPAKAVERLYRAGDGGVRRLPFTNREALMQACRVDVGLSSACSL